MGPKTVGIADGKRLFSRLVDEVSKGKGKVLVTKRGKPVAVILSYQEYEKRRRMEGFTKVMEARKDFEGSGLRASEIYEESRVALEERG